MSLPYLQMIGRSHERSIPTCMDLTHTNIHVHIRTYAEHPYIHALEFRLIVLIYIDNSTGDAVQHFTI